MDFVFHPDGIKDENRFHWAGRAGGADRINRIFRIFVVFFSFRMKLKKQSASRKGRNILSQRPRDRRGHWDSRF